MICNRLLMLSDVSLPRINPVWSALTKTWITLSKCNARDLAHTLRSVVSRDISLKLDHSEDPFPFLRERISAIFSSLWKETFWIAKLRVKHKWAYHIPKPSNPRFSLLLRAFSTLCSSSRVNGASNSSWAACVIWGSSKLSRLLQIDSLKLISDLYNFSKSNIKVVVVLIGGLLQFYHLQLLLLGWVSLFHIL